MSFLGGSALYIYMLHMPFIYFYVQLRGKTPAVPYSWAEVFWVVAIVSTVLGCAVKVLMDEFVLKKNKRAKAAVAKAVATEPAVAEKVEEPKKASAKKPAVKPVAKASAPKKAEQAPVKKAEVKVVAKAPAKKSEVKAPAKKAEPKKAPAKAPAKAASKPASKTTKKIK